MATPDRPSGPFLRQSGAAYTDPSTGEMVRPLAFMHYCEHPGCTRWGSFGFGANLRRKVPGKWFCVEHKEDGEAYLREMRDRPAASPPADPA